MSQEQDSGGQKAVRDQGWVQRLGLAAGPLLWSYLVCGGGVPLLLSSPERNCLSTMPSHAWTTGWGAAYLTKLSPGNDIKG